MAEMEQLEAETGADLLNKYCIEFGDEEDVFLSVREKGARYWIAKHIWEGTNKYFILFWFIFTILNTYFRSIIFVYIGDAVEAFRLGQSGAVTQYFKQVLLFGLLSVSFTFVANILREFLAQRLERD